jgi:hypothetical protein
MSSAFGPAIYILLAAAASWSLSDLFALLPPLAVVSREGAHVLCTADMM